MQYKTEGVSSGVMTSPLIEFTSKACLSLAFSSSSRLPIRLCLVARLGTTSPKVRPFFPLLHESRALLTDISCNPAAHPYYILSPHAQITFASPKGGPAPVDPTSVEQFKSDPDSTKFLSDPTVKEKFARALTLSNVVPSEYDAVFYPGGHGPVVDLASDPLNIKVAEQVSVTLLHFLCGE